MVIFEEVNDLSQSVNESIQNINENLDTNLNTNQELKDSAGTQNPTTSQGNRYYLLYRTNMKIFSTPVLNYELKIGDKLVVKIDEYVTDVFEVRSKVAKKVDENVTPTVQILHKASDEELNLVKIAASKDAEYFKKVKQALKNYKDMNMNLISVHVYPFTNKMLISYTSPSRVDYRQFVADSTKVFGLRAIMRQIITSYCHIQRAAAPLWVSCGICGREPCCKKHINVPNVSISELKQVVWEQALLKSPEKNLGVCGVAKCCLFYEYDWYVEIKKTFPKIHSTITINNLDYKIVSINYLTGVIQLTNAEELSSQTLNISDLKKVGDKWQLNDS